MRLIASSLISSISSSERPGSMRTNLRERYSRSTCSFMRKLLPLKVRSTSKTTSPVTNPRSVCRITTWSSGTHSPLKYAVKSLILALL